MSNENEKGRAGAETKHRAREHSGQLILFRQHILWRRERQLIDLEVKRQQTKDGDKRVLLRDQQSWRLNGFKALKECACWVCCSCYCATYWALTGQIRAERSGQEIRVENLRLVVHLHRWNVERDSRASRRSESQIEVELVESWERERERASESRELNRR